MFIFKLEFLQSAKNQINSEYSANCVKLAVGSI